MLNARSARLAVVFLLAAPLAALCDPADDFLRAEMKRQRIPGLSLVVLRNGEVIKAAGLTIIVLMNLDDVDIDAIVGGLAAVYMD